MASRHGRCTHQVRQGSAKQTDEARVSQEEFADMCEMDRTYIGGIERGERNLSLVNIEKIARTLEISLF
jgi:transcriptional regulator with XRE-family HTH domain